MNDEDNNPNVFSEFDVEKDFELRSNGSIARSRDSEGVFLNLKSSLNSFQYTHAYCLPKTQTHKKFLSVFKPRKFTSLRSKEERLGVADILDDKFNNEERPGQHGRAATQELSDSHLLANSHGESEPGKNIRMPSTSIQRMVQFHKGSKGFLVIEPPSKTNLQSSAKYRKLGSMMSILKSKDTKKSQAATNKNISTVEENLEKLEKAIDDLATLIINSQESLKIEDSIIK